jgi:orotate phosphoribosyltransferase
MDFDKFVVENDTKIYWDEWNFYSSNNNLIEAADALAKQLNDTDPYVLCALSKSGLPLASVLSLILKKPLLIFTIGEFFTAEGLPIIEVVGGENYRSFSWCLIDSHIHTGQTALLAETSIKSQYSAHVKACYVIADCRKGGAFALDVVSLYKRDRTWASLNEIAAKKSIKPEPLLESNDFWMYHDKSWLTYLPEDIADPKQNYLNVEVKSAQSNIRDIILEEDVILPKNLFLDPNEFYSWMSNIANTFTDVDLIIASTIGGIPLAAALTYCFSEKNKAARFIFMGNNSLDYYKRLVQSHQNAIIVDDVVSAGSIVAAIYHALLSPLSISLSGVVCLAKIAYPDESSYLRENVGGIPLYAAVV